MRGLLRPASVSRAFLTVVTGLGYPRLVTGIAQLLPLWQANGGLMLKDGTPVGSALNRAAPRRSEVPLEPAVRDDDNAGASTGSNPGPTNPDLAKAVQGRIDALRAADPGNAGADPGSTS
jgi:K+-transporting ATPase ATPase C chain